MGALDTGFDYDVQKVTLSGGVALVTWKQNFLSAPILLALTEMSGTTISRGFHQSKFTAKQGYVVENQVTKTPVCRVVVWGPVGLGMFVRP